MAGLSADGGGEEKILYCYSVLHRGFTRLVKQRRIVLHTWVVVQVGKNLFRPQCRLESGCRNEQSL